MKDRIRLYDDLADWWPLLSAPEDYAGEAGVYRSVLLEHGVAAGASVLELGSGGGNNASHLGRDFRMTLTDRSPRMLEVSRGLNPGVEHLEGDMRTLRLGRAFDAVFVHDAVMYLTEGDDLVAAFRTAWEHLCPGGVALFVPDCVRETFRPHTGHGGHDGAAGRGLRYLEWTWDPDPSDSSCRMELTMVLREALDAPVRIVHDSHPFGLFPRDTWLEGLRSVGFAARHLEVGAEEELDGVFVAVR